MVKQINSWGRMLPNDSNQQKLSTVNVLNVHCNGLEESGVSLNKILYCNITIERCPCTDTEQVERRESGRRDEGESATDINFVVTCDLATDLHFDHCSIGTPNTMISRQPQRMCLLWMPCLSAISLEYIQ